MKIKQTMIVCLSLMAIPLIAYAQDLPPLGENMYKIKKDEFTDEESHWLWYTSNEFGDYSKTVSMVISCNNNKTALNFSGGGYVWKSTINNRQSNTIKTQYRLDGKQATSMNLIQNHEASAILGTAAIAHIQTIIGNDVLKIGLQMSNGVRIHTFNVGDMESDIKPIRENCGW